MRKCGKRSLQGPGRPNCGVQGVGSSSTVGCIRPALDPDLLIGLTPAREDADAVAAGSDLVEVIVKRLPAQSFKHALFHLVGWLYIQGDASDRAEGAQSDYHTVEVESASGCLEDLPVGRHNLQPGDGGGEIATGDAGSVRRRRHGSGDGD